MVSGYPGNSYPNLLLCKLTRGCLFRRSKIILESVQIKTLAYKNITKTIHWFIFLNSIEFQLNLIYKEIHETNLDFIFVPNIKLIHEYSAIISWIQITYVTGLCNLLYNNKFITMMQKLAAAGYATLLLWDTYVLTKNPEFPTYPKANNGGCVRKKIHHLFE